MDDHNLAREKLIEELSQACDGLMWLSESDYPWQVFCWKDESQINSTTLLKQYDYQSDIKVLNTTLDTFFKNVTVEQEWHNEIEKSETQRYQDLSRWLKINLRDMQVFLVGEVEIDAYILGKVNNDIIGLATKIIET